MALLFVGVGSDQGLGSGDRGFIRFDLCLERLERFGFRRNGSDERFKFDEGFDLRFESLILLFENIVSVFIVGDGAKLCKGG